MKIIDAIIPDDLVNKIVNSRKETYHWLKDMDEMTLKQLISLQRNSPTRLVDYELMRKEAGMLKKSINIQIKVLKDAKKTLTDNYGWGYK